MQEKVPFNPTYRDNAYLDPSIKAQLGYLREPIELPLYVKDEIVPPHLEEILLGTRGKNESERLEVARQFIEKCHSPGLYYVRGVCTFNQALGELYYRTMDAIFIMGSLNESRLNRRDKANRNLYLRLCEMSKRICIIYDQVSRGMIDHTPNKIENIKRELTSFSVKEAASTITIEDQKRALLFFNTLNRLACYIYDYEALIKQIREG